MASLIKLVKGKNLVERKSQKNIQRGALSLYSHSQVQSDLETVNEESLKNHKTFI